jgi:hypothetical protein
MENSINKNVVIKSGTLNLTINYLNPAYSSIDDLVTFASRENKKRGFLFVSKVLGKHIPVKPSAMRKSYDLLASEIGADASNTVVVGMSETAVGLGGGLADSLSKMHDSGKVIFQHTTRHELMGQEIWFDINESHSHATDHLIYKPVPILKMEMEKAERLVLVDDEISTGRTLFQLACGYLQKLRNIKVLHLVSLISWMDDEMDAQFERRLKKYCEQNDLSFPKLVFSSLAKGSFVFHKSETFCSDLPEKTDVYMENARSRSSYGRKGMLMPMLVEDDKLISWAKERNSKLPVSVIGTGEHLFNPFMVAEVLEKHGIDAFFQSTTRSPIIVDGDIESKTVIEFQRDNGKVVNHFIYNLDMSGNSHNMFFFESEQFASRHKHLIGMHGAS